MEASPHVLLAEDDDLVAVVLTTLLESHGFRVTMTHDGQHALDTEAKDAADLLVTDLRMPVMNGNELVRQIRQRRPELPILVITGYSECTPSEEPGRLVVLHKPFPMDSVVQAVRELLE